MESTRKSTGGREPAESPRDERAPGAGSLAAAGAGIGAATTATVASLCCTGPVLAPLIVAALGASGAAWAAGLKPYSPWILAGSGALLAYTFWTIYRPAARCEAPQGARAGTRLLRGVVKGTAWFAALAWIAAVAANILFA